MGFKTALKVGFLILPEVLTALPTVAMLGDIDVLSLEAMLVFV